MTAHRRARWSPTGLPEVRDDLARITRAAAEHAQRLKASSTKEALDIDLVVTELWDEVAALNDAELFWVTGPMGRLAGDAATDMPTWSPGIVRPTPVGLLAWAEPVMQVEWDDAPDEAARTDAFGASHGPFVDVDAVVWAPERSGITVTFYCRTRRVKDWVRARWAAGPLVSLCSAWMDHDWEPGAVDEVAALPAAVRPNLIDRRPRTIPPSVHAALAVLGTTWTLMQQTTVATRTPSGRRPVQGALDITTPTHRPAVVIVDLRRQLHPADPDHHEDGARTFTHRWLVRGHWRQQACGPHRSLRRPTWIPPHVKGPDDAPLIEKTTVQVWRR